jgi:predicted  nucleic acid-binding Zn-ribbon protein
MEAGDGLQAAVKDAEHAAAQVRTESDEARRALGAERRDLDAEITRLTEEKRQASADVAKPVLTRYEQLLKQRKMLAVAEMQGELCAACHVRLRPAITQQVRRGMDLVACDSCQRILYAKPAPAADATTSAAPA